MPRPALAIAMLIACIGLLIVTGSGDETAVLGMRPPLLAGRKIILDPGHGGMDGGASHPGIALLEKDLTLDIALRMAELLEACGATVVMTRRRDEMKGSYMQDLLARVDLANRSGGEVLVSIHVNYYPDPSCWGGQTFHAPGCDEGARLAGLIQEELAHIQPGNDRLPQAATYTVLASTTMPAVLVEVAFISNPADREKLADDGFRTQLAKAIVRALVRFCR